MRSAGAFTRPRRSAARLRSRHGAPILGAMSRPRLLVIEDGEEYREFAQMFLSEEWDIVPARSLKDALAALEAAPIRAMLVDLRFERARAEDLTGDVAEVASRMFGGDTSRALRWLKDQQGTLVLAALRAAGHPQRAVFVHDFPRERVANLRRLYGDVASVPGFDAAAILAALGAPG